MVKCPHCGAVLNSTGITEHIEVCWLDNFDDGNFLEMARRRAFHCDGCGGVLDSALVKDLMVKGEC